MPGAGSACRLGRPPGRCRRADRPEQMPREAVLREPARRSHRRPRSSPRVRAAPLRSAGRLPDKCGAAGSRSEATLVRDALHRHDIDINIATEHPEFEAWKWVAAEELTRLTCRSNARSIRGPRRVSRTLSALTAPPPHRLRRGRASPPARRAPDRRGAAALARRRADLRASPASRLAARTPAKVSPAPVATGSTASAGTSILVPSGRNARAPSAPRVTTSACFRQIAIAAGSDPSVAASPSLAMRRSMSSSRAGAMGPAGARLRTMRAAHEWARAINAAFSAIGTSRCNTRTVPGSSRWSGTCAARASRLAPEATAI